MSLPANAQKKQLWCSIRVKLLLLISLAGGLQFLKYFKGGVEADPDLDDKSLGDKLNGNNTQTQMKHGDVLRVNVRGSLPLYTSGRPNFVLHIGPGKTGSSTIQDAIHSKQIQELLESDNYDTLDQDIIHRHDLLKKIDGKYEFNAGFREAMEKQRNDRPNKHILGSSEWINVEEAQCDLWQELIKVNSTRHWNLNVVINYRRLHEHLPSLWNQMFKLHRENGRLRKRHDWPGTNGATRILSFEEFLGEKLPNAKSPMYHRAYSNYNAWKRCAEKITLLDFHHPSIVLQNGIVLKNDLMTSFVCNGVIGANETCSSLVQGVRTVKGKDKKKNLSAKLDNGILADYAYENGFIGKGFDRPEVEKAITKFLLANDGMTLPMSCPNSTVLQRLYDFSLKGEEWAHSVLASQRSGKAGGDILTPLNAERLQEFDLSWNQTLEEKKFCTVDGAEAMNRDAWRSFFRQYAEARL